MLKGMLNNEEMPHVGSLDVDLGLDASGVAGPPAWTQLLPAGNVPPAPRYAHTAVYDPVSNTMIVFAGQIDYSEIPVNDVFVLQHANGR